MAAPVVDMLLAAWGATMGRPAFITSTVSDILGAAPRTFRRGSPITPPHLGKVQRRESTLATVRHRTKVTRGGTALYVSGGFCGLRPPVSSMVLEGMR